MSRSPATACLLADLPMRGRLMPREWLVRSVDEQGEVDRAGFLSRPARPSRTHANVLDGGTVRAPSRLR